jgi:hypothetical protein
VAGLLAAACQHPWQQGVTRLQLLPPPLGVTSARWRQLQLDAARLLAEQGPALERMGWTAVDGFGLHPGAPSAAVDCYGSRRCCTAAG